MSSRKYNKPLNVDLKPSKILFYFIIVIHLLALSVLFLDLDIPPGTLIILFILINISQHFCLQQNSSIQYRLYIENIHWQTEMQWCLVSSDNQSSFATLQENWFVLPWLIILYFKIDGNKNKTIIILPDMICANDMRYLKLHLKTR